MQKSPATCPGGGRLANVAQGTVPRAQSSNRAESGVVLAAAQFVQRTRQEAAEVLGDSTSAISEHSRVLREECPRYPDMADAMAQADAQRLKMQKVKAHQQLQNLWGLPIWHALGNDCADLAARNARKRDYQRLFDTLDQAAECEQEQRDLLLVFHRYLMELSQEEWKLKKQALRALPKRKSKHHRNPCKCNMQGKLHGQRLNHLRHLPGPYMLSKQTVNGSHSETLLCE